MKAYIFPGQGSQFPGMGKELYENDSKAKELFERANELLGYKITDTMFNGSKEELKETKITQPSIFLHSVIISETRDIKPDMVAGHSLGEFSALVANKTLSFEDALLLVYKRAMAMQKACEAEPSTMAAVLGLDDNIVEEVCGGIEDVVVPANYNSPGQVVISGSNDGVNTACEKLKEKGAKRAALLPVGGAFHSPLMEPAGKELKEAIDKTDFNDPICPIYQNVTATPTDNPDEIRKNLNKQLTSPVKWTQTIKNMLNDGGTSFTEIGPGRVLQGLVKKVDPQVEVGGVQV
ncbi:MAG: ACP S-malonyltransferase [Flavobacteriales bacterium]